MKSRIDGIFYFSIMDDRSQFLVDGSREMWWVLTTSCDKFSDP